MRRAAGLYRLHLAIGLGGGLGVLLGLLVALDAATTHQQPPRMLIAAILFSPSTIAAADAALLLALGAIVTGSLVFGLRAVTAPRACLMPSAAPSRVLTGLSPGPTWLLVSHRRTAAVHGTVGRTSGGPFAVSSGQRAAG